MEREACGWTCSKGHYCANDATGCLWHNDNMIEFRNGERCPSCEATDEQAAFLAERVAR